MHLLLFRGHGGICPADTILSLLAPPDLAHFLVLLDMVEEICWQLMASGTMMQDAPSWCLNDSLVRG